MRHTCRILCVGAVIPCIVAGCVDSAVQSPAPSAPPVQAESVTPARTSHLDSLLQSADSLLRQQTDSASALWRIALTDARSSSDTARVARALTGLGQAARLTGDFAASRQQGEEALQLKVRAGLDADLSRSYNALGLLAWNEGRLGDAAPLLDSAETTARRNGDLIAATKAVVNTGLVAQDRGLFTRARAAFRRGHDAAAASGDSVTLGRVLNNLAALDIALGDPLSAIASLTTVRQIAVASADSVLEVNAIGQLGTAYNRLGEPQRAMRLLDSALAMARRRGYKREEGENMALLADLSLEAGDHQHALRSYERALGRIDAAEQPDEHGTVLRNLARVHAALGNPALAVKRATVAWREHAAAGLPYSELGDLIVLATLAAQQGQTGKARGHLARAHVIADSLAAPVAKTSLAVAEASVAIAAREPARALRALDAVAATMPLAGSAMEAEALALRARAHADLGQLDAAIEAGRRALDAMERVRAHYPTAALRTAYASDRASVYASQALLLLRVGRTAEAFEVADAARGRALLEHLTTVAPVLAPVGDASAAVRAEGLLARIDALVARLQSRELERTGERSALADPVTGELRDSLLAARAEYEALVARAPTRSAPEAAMSLAVRPLVAASTVRDRLFEGELLLEYFVTPERTLVFALSRGSIRVFEISEKSAAVARRVALARELMQRPDGEHAARPVLRALHTLLLSPVQEAGLLDGVARLVIVPHGALTYLPFAALLDPLSGRYVAERFAVQRSQTSASLAMLRSAPARANQAGSAAVFAPLPDALPASRAEAEAVSRSVPSATLRIGPQATEAGVRAALAGSAIVHVATHARLNARNPLFSYLQLASAAGDARTDRRNDAHLEVHELLALRIRAPLVFLSGCETGLGGAWSTAFDAGEDYATMSQALLYAGARNVIATLWRIDDAGAATFAQRFYTALPGRTAADALAAAQRATLVDRRFRSPYYWAAYEISGAGEGSAAAATTARKYGQSIR